MLPSPQNDTCMANQYTIVVMGENWHKVSITELWYEK